MSNVQIKQYDGANYTELNPKPMSFCGLGDSEVNWAEDYDANNAKLNRWWCANKNTPKNSSGINGNFIIRVDGIGKNYFCQTGYGLKTTGYNQSVWMRWFEGDYWTEWVKIFDTYVPFLSLQFGVYVGTGTYGESNQNTIKVSQRPKLAFISQERTKFYGQDSMSPFLIFLGQKYQGVWKSGHSCEVYYTVTDTSLSWYASYYDSNVNTGSWQFNSTGITYYYVILS